jgi:hypothetical protein
MDKIVAVTTHRDYILVFTERGFVYRLVVSDLNDAAKIELLLQMDMTRVR